MYHILPLHFRFQFKINALINSYWLLVMVKKKTTMMMILSSSSSFTMMIHLCFSFERAFNFCGWFLYRQRYILYISMWLLLLFSVFFFLFSLVMLLCDGHFNSSHCLLQCSCFEKSVLCVCIVFVFGGFRKIKGGEVKWIWNVYFFFRIRVMLFGEFITLFQFMTWTKQIIYQILMFFFFFALSPFALGKIEIPFACKHLIQFNFFFLFALSLFFTNVSL